MMSHWKGFAGVNLPTSLPHRMMTCGSLYSSPLPIPHHHFLQFYSSFYLQFLFGLIVFYPVI
ncbi:hypothetical protein MtrunA17_Chr8g0361801 [Medicago truncatula]|uniref:Transmembrane protein n=1 Tax=Medicago truncatula TaxID=3880 RepID=A0A396GIT5_MEDTR|nr:hypothetical protein MtrunA17_Chr8g0361801 [Medicago truncatula]